MATRNPGKTATITISGSDGPTRRGIEAMLRKLKLEWFMVARMPQHAKVANQIDALEKALRETPRYKRLSKQLDILHDRHRKYIADHNAEVERLKRLYFADGLTDEVVSGVRKLMLVEEKRRKICRESP